MLREGFGRHATSDGCGLFGRALASRRWLAGEKQRKFVTLAGRRPAFGSGAFEGASGYSEGSFAGSLEAAGWLAG